MGWRESKILHCKTASENGKVVREYQPFLGNVTVGREEGRKGYHVY